MASFVSTRSHYTLLFRRAVNASGGQRGPGEMAAFVASCGSSYLRRSSNCFAGENSGLWRRACCSAFLAPLWSFL